MIPIAAHQPLKAIVDADDLARACARFESQRADDAIDTGRRPAADQYSNVRIMIVCRACHRFT